MVVKQLAGSGTGQSLSDMMTAVKHTLSGSLVAKVICKATTEEMISPKRKHLALYIRAKIVRSRLRQLSRQPYTAQQPGRRFQSIHYHTSSNAIWSRGKHTFCMGYLGLQRFISWMCVCLS
ncbi:hypothetical protein AHF37_11958 [Paragonimus kellicotti]|nr:hypothetical protein AHF37_11958 [Paragonimus kellicotti]